MRGPRAAIPVAMVLALCACSSASHPGSSVSRASSGAQVPSSGPSSTRPTDQGGTRAWVLAVAPDTKKLRDQIANLQYAWNGAQGAGSQARGYALELDQIAVHNVQPDAAALAAFLRGRAGQVAVADAKYAHDFAVEIGEWQRAAALAHAIKTVAQTYNSNSKTTQAMDAFDEQLLSTEDLWNRTVLELWSAAGISPPPLLDESCAPTNKAACNQ